MEEITVYHSQCSVCLREYKVTAPPSLCFSCFADSIQMPSKSKWYDVKWISLHIIIYMLLWGAVQYYFGAQCGMLFVFGYLYGFFNKVIVDFVANYY